MTPSAVAERLDARRARELAGELGLTDDEYDRIVTTLDRVPTTSELGIYSVMWSEHCSYKSSRSLLSSLPTDSPRVLVGPGENAGVLDVGEGLAIAFKLESHNHPSFVEPYQGAATGVGGIIRDILTMGARPVAIMDPLRFGLPDDPKQRRLIDGIVRGVGGYGNCVGVANIGGETVFDDSYAGNPLVNVFCLGVMKADQLQLARAEKPGDIAVLLGSATGRDGIGGASVLASAEFDEESADKRPSVQVGDPFAEKQLIECCLELYDQGILAGIQDMGAAGIACSTAEMASAAGLGISVDLDQVHLRVPTMESWEILCSESQERMLALVSPTDLAQVLGVAERWGVPASVIGEVTAGSDLEIIRGGGVVAQAPAKSVADEGPVYDRPRERPAWLDDYAAVDAEHPTLPDDLEAFCLDFLASPNVASKRWVWEQYDAFVGHNTVLGPGGDAGVIRLPDSDLAVACSTDGNGRWCELDPREGTRRVVAEAYRNVACAGAVPIGVTNCLNFGNPERPEIMWQFAEAVAGIGEACRALDVPITGGNVSFYNETRGPDGNPRAIHPTPVIGIVGLIEKAERAVDPGFKGEGDVIFEVGAPTADGLAGSELQRFLGQPLGGTLAPVDLDAEAKVAALLAAAVKLDLMRSAHDISTGGLLAALAESCVVNGRGVRYVLPDVDPAQALFSESPTRVLVSVRGPDMDQFGRLCEARDVHVRKAGVVVGDRLVVQGLIDLPLSDVQAAYEGALGRLLDAR